MFVLHFTVKMTDNLKFKRVRSSNTTAAEREFLVELVQKYHHILENKRTDAVSTGQKDKTWQIVATEYNALASQKRDGKQLKTVSIKGFLYIRYLCLLHAVYKV